MSRLRGDPGKCQAWAARAPSRAAGLMLALVLCAAVPRADGANAFNRGWPVGTNLTAVEDFRSEYPFVDFIKQGRPWFSGTVAQLQDGRALALDAEGNVSSLLPGHGPRWPCSWSVPLACRWRSDPEL